VADLLLISKTDIASISDVHSVRSKLGRINPNAQIRNAHEEAIDPPHLIFRTRVGNVGGAATGVDSTSDESAVAYQATFLREGAGKLLEEGVHTNGLNVFTVYHDAPIAETALQLWLHMLAGFRGHDVLRVKGILNVEGNPLVVHLVQTIIDEPVRLERWPSDDRRSRLVFITRTVTKLDVERMLDDLSLWAVKRPADARTTIDPAAYADFVRLATSVRAAGK
jgi:G3E family GTPase